MIVHVGVVIIAVAFAASSSFGHRTEVTLKQGQSTRFAGHTVTYLGTTTEKHSNRTSLTARLRLDGTQTMRPALSQFPFASQAIGTPSVKVGLRDDVYLTLVQAPDAPGGPAIVGIIIQPLVSWLWLGGLVIALGTLLAAWPGRRRRRPTDPASAPVPLDDDEREPVGAPV